jgi:hypothetical protein
MPQLPYRVVICNGCSAKRFRPRRVGDVNGRQARRPETPMAASARPSARHDPGVCWGGRRRRPEVGGRGLHAVAGRHGPVVIACWCGGGSSHPPQPRLAPESQRGKSLRTELGLNLFGAGVFPREWVADPMNRCQRHPMNWVSPSEIPSAAAHYDEHWTGYRTAAAARVVVCGAVCGVVGR